MKKNWNNPTLKMLEVEKTYEDNDCLVTDSTGQTVTEKAFPIPACDLDITFNVKCLCLVDGHMEKHVIPLERL